MPLMCKFFCSEGFVIHVAFSRMDSNYVHYKMRTLYLAKIWFVHGVVMGQICIDDMLKLYISMRIMAMSNGLLP